MQGWTFKYSFYVALFMAVVLTVSFWNIFVAQVMLGATLVIHVLANLEVWFKYKKS